MIENLIQQGPIVFNPDDHSYRHQPTNKKLTSVSAVIGCVYAAKSWDGVPPAVIENARVRGVAVDRYMSQYVRDREITIENETQEVVERTKAAHRIWEEQFHGLPAQAQVIVYSLEDGIAGTLDFYVDNRIVVDLKNTYTKEISWVLQVGAYAEYSGNAERAGVIHISPQVYPKGGVWIEYDVQLCRYYWRRAVGWWQETKQMVGAAKAGKRGHVE
jgi:hypothetical protein